MKQKDLGETKRYEGVVVQKSSLLNKEIQRGRGSWIVDRGSWIEDPKCPVLPGIMIPSETEISKNLEKEARNESWAEENKLHSCST